jgi:hypothetical protein
MRNLVLSAENTRDAMGALNAGNGFDRKGLIAEFHKASDFRATRFYNTIPESRPGKRFRRWLIRRVTFFARLP